MSYDVPVREPGPLAARAAVRRVARNRPHYRLHLPTPIEDYVSSAQWHVFGAAIDAVRALGTPFALGGGLATSLYTGHWRPSKDIDIYVAPEDRQPVIDAVLASGLDDYYDELPYDRAWIFRGARDGTIVDVMWALANGAGEVRPDWLQRGASVELHGTQLRLLAPDELFWSKVHVLQRDRCDWPDLLNLLYATGPQFDWVRLLQRMSGHERLLGALLSLFAWVAPGRAQRLPAWLWQRLQLEPPHGPAAARCDDRIRLLDTRPWFTDADVGP